MAINPKKLFAAFLAVCMALTISGCNGGGESTSGETSETSEAEEAPIKVGYIYHGSADEGRSAEFDAQRKKAQSHSTVETCYIENVMISDFEAAVKMLADEGCGTIVSTNPVYANVLTSTAGKYMNINFIGYGIALRSVNIFAYTEHTFQGAYAAGTAAAFNSQNEKIGIVCDTDMLYPIPVINAAALGMQLVYSDARLMAAFGTKPDELRSAVDMLTDAGCDVIICYTENSEAEKYCESKGIKFISSLDHSADSSEYENMLMYFYSSRDSFYLSQFKKLQLDAWETDSYVGSMNNGVVDVSDALPAAKDGTADILSALIPKITTGKALIFSGELKDTTGSIKYMQNDVMTITEVYNMSWYVQGVEILGNLRQPQTDLVTSNLEIKY